MRACSESAIILKQSYFIICARFVFFENSARDFLLKRRCHFHATTARARTAQAPLVRHHVDEQTRDASLSGAMTASSLSSICRRQVTFSSSRRCFSSSTRAQAQWGFIGLGRMGMWSPCARTWPCTDSTRLSHGREPQSSASDCRQAYHL